jgi:hypothetical protein
MAELIRTLVTEGGEGPHYLASHQPQTAACGRPDAHRNGLTLNNV